MYTLYINGMKADLRSDTSIEWTASSVDYSNPTVVRNSFTKTISLDGTPNNNRIFGNLYGLDRRQDISDPISFNPVLRTPFMLYNGMELVEEGYCKVENIVRNSKSVVYEITLYGGLSQFLFNLSYGNSEEGEKINLGELDFGIPDFIISKDTVNDAWDNIQKKGSIWEKINFMPDTQGVPDNFSADKIVLNTDGLECTVRYGANGKVENGTFPKEIVQEGTTYRTTDGFLYGTASKELTYMETRDFRSWLMQPVMRVKHFIGTILSKENNGGYTVLQDPDFFSQQNPYWEDMWITLPKIDTATSVSDKQDWDWRIEGTSTVNRYSITFSLTQPPVFNTLPFQLQIDSEIRAENITSTASELFLASYNPSEEIPNRLGGIAIQVYLTDRNNTVIGGSSPYILVSETPDGSYMDIDELIAQRLYKPIWNSKPITVKGTFKRDSSGRYVWNGEPFRFLVDVENVPYENVRVDVRLLANAVKDGGLWSFGNRRGVLYETNSNGTPKEFSPKVYDTGESCVWLKGDEIIPRSNTRVSLKSIMERMDGTPADWLLSYCKMFGLFLSVDTRRKRVEIWHRSRFYRNECTSLEGHMDMYNEWIVNPLTFDAKFYRMAHGDSGTALEDEYSENTQVPYGSQTIDTRFNFNNTVTDITEKILFSNVVDSLHKSNYYTIYKDSEGREIPNTLQNWVEFQYVSGENTLEVPVAYPSSNTREFYNKDYITYFNFAPFPSLFDKDGKGVDGSGILLFYRGLAGTGNSYINITDDTSLMWTLNDRNPCWLITQKEYDSKGNRIAIKRTSVPQFGRYEGEYNMIGVALDYGRPKTMYIPDSRILPDDSTVYEKFWKGYIQDLYSVDTKTVECNVVFPEIFNPSFFRKFWWFGNSEWVLSKAENIKYLPGERIKCTFTRVNDRQAYLAPPKYRDYLFSVVQIEGPDSFPASGDDLSVVFEVKSDKSWSVEKSDSYGVFITSGGYVTSGSGDSQPRLVKYRALANTGNIARIHTLTFTRSDGKSVKCTYLQKGVSIQPYLKVSPESFSLPYKDDGKQYRITIESSSKWNLSDNGDWLDFTGIEGDAGVGYVDLVFTDNPTASERSATVSIVNTDNITRTVEVVQKGMTSIQLERIDKGAVISKDGGTARYNVIANGPWTLVRDSDWRESILEPWEDDWSNAYAIPNPKSGTGNAEIQVSYIDNFQPYTRTAKFYISDNGTQKIYEKDGDYGTQEAGKTTVVNVTAPSQKVPLEITTDTEGITSWDTVEGEQWLTILNPSGTGNVADISFNVSENQGSERKSIIYLTFRGNNYTELRVIEVIQKGNEGLTVIPVRIPNLEWNDSNTYRIDVTAPSSWDYTKPDWIDAVKGENYLKIQVQKNLLGTARTGFITFSSNGDTATTEVIQTANPSFTSSYVDIQPIMVIFPGSGGTQPLMVKSSREWVIEKTGGSVVTGITVSINQISFTEDGGKKTVKVSSESNWTASYPAFITLSSTNGQAGDTLVSITAKPNPNYEPLSGIVKFSIDENTYAEVKVTVEGNSDAPYLTVLPEGIEFTKQGGSKSITITTNKDWRISYIPEWLVANPVSGTSGMNDVDITASQNISFDERIDRIEITADTISKTVAVVQKGETLSGITASSNSLTFEPEGGTKAVTILSESDWSASYPAFITLSQTSGTSGSTQVSITSKANEYTDPLNGIVKFRIDENTYAVVNVVLKGNPDALDITFTPEGLEFEKQGGTQTLSVDSNKDWRFSYIPEWIVANPASGSVGITEVEITASNNKTGSERTEAIKVTVDGQIKTIPVVQRYEIPEGISVSPNSLQYPYSGGEKDVDLTSSGDWNASYPAWITLSKTNGTSGETTVRITARRNENLSSLKGLVTFTTGEWSDSVEVMIDGNPNVPAEINLSPQGFSFVKAGGTQVMEVDSTEEWSVSEKDSWITAVPSSGSKGRTAVSISVPENTTGAERYGTITFRTKSGVEEMGSIHQRYEITGIATTPTSLEWEYTGGEKTVNISSSGNWNAAYPAWTTLSQTNGTSGDTQITITAKENKYLSPMEGKIRFRISETTYVDLDISIKGNPDATSKLEITPEYLTFVQEGETKTLSLTCTESWRLSYKPEWITVSPLKGGASENTGIKVSASENTTGKQRMERIEFLSQTGMERIIPIIQN